MRNFEDLLGTLAKLINLTLYSHLFNGIFDLFYVYHSFVCKGVEEIESLDSLWASLLVPKN